MNKRLVVVFLGFGLVLGGCSSAPSEVSPEEKRNNYDLCILNEMEIMNEEIEELERLIEIKLENNLSPLSETERIWYGKSLEERQQFRDFSKGKMEIYCKGELE